MTRRIFLLLALFLGSGVTGSAGALDFEVEARLKMAHQIAREQNDEHLVHRVMATAAAIRASASGEAVENLLRETESAVGIDPGGWSMAGQPLFRPTPAMLETAPRIRAGLDAALLSGMPEEVAKVIEEWRGILGDQAGVPDGRRSGMRPGPLLLDEAGATRLFVEVLRREGKAVRELSKGVPVPHQMLRFYGYLLEGLSAARPSVAKHTPGDLAALDGLARGTGKILLDLQQPGGHFPFPDLRGKNIRFGDMIDRQLAAGAIEVRDGWVVTADPDGGTQFDTGVCGAALLQAGKIFEEPAFTEAGLRAADWAAKQRCVGNFNYNAFSVSLLARAYEVSGRVEYLDAAYAKFELGVAPGQAPNGRWIDSHNARTVYHVIILGATGDLLRVLPAERVGALDQVKPVAGMALDAILEEFEAMGITVECLPELIALEAHFPERDEPGEAIDRVAASLVEKCSAGTRVRMGAQPHQLGALVARLRGGELATSGSR